MSYQDQLNPWVIHQLLPDLQQNTIARFRRRHDAEAYLKAMQRMQPQTEFQIGFDAAQTARKAATPNLPAATNA